MKIKDCKCGIKVLVKSKSVCKDHALCITSSTMDERFEYFLSQSPLGVGTINNIFYCKNQETEVISVLPTRTQGRNFCFKAKDLIKLTE